MSVSFKHNKEEAEGACICLHMCYARSDYQFFKSQHDETPQCRCAGGLRGCFFSIFDKLFVSRVYLCISSFELPLSSFSDKKTDNFFNDGEGRTAGDESIAST